jgi:hypothetical protein
MAKLTLKERILATLERSKNPQTVASIQDAVKVDYPIHGALGELLRDKAIVKVSRGTYTRNGTEPSAPRTESKPALHVQTAQSARAAGLVGEVRSTVNLTSEGDSLVLQDGPDRWRIAWNELSRFIREQGTRS